LHPIIFQIGKITLYTYGLFVGLGFLAAVTFAGKRAESRGIVKDNMTDLFFVILISSVIGARLLYVLLNFQDFSGDFFSVFKIWTGGLVFYGGFIAALIASFVYVKRKGLSLGKTADILAPAIALGHALGRLGCLFAGCCYGRQCDLPWAIAFDNPDSLAPLHINLHPTQIYSVLSNLLLFAILIIVDKRKKADGVTFWSYIFLYGIFRSVIETFRGDPRGEFLLDFLSVSQGIGLCMSFAGLCMLIYLHRSTAYIDSTGK